MNGLRITAAFVLTLALSACDNRDPVVTLESPAASPTTQCTIKLYEPSYVPDGFEPGPTRTAEPGMGPERSRTWSRGDRSFSVDLGTSGDFGDDPTVKAVDVLGHDGALGAANAEGSPRLVAWDEGAVGSCYKQYMVSVVGLDDNELLRVANSLKEEGAS
jgi:hypothetical protein